MNMWYYRWLLLVCGFFASYSTTTAHAQNVQDLLIKGADYQYNGELDKAEKVFEKVIRQDPENEYALNQLGLIRAKKESFDKAYTAFKKVVKLSEDNTFARTWLGVLELHKNNLDAAFDQFRKTLRIDPNNANAYYFLGVIYSVEHNMKKSIEYLRKAQKVGSDDPETHYRLANAFSGLDMVYNARLGYERALELNPEYIKAINALGWLYYNQEEKEKAIKKWKKALEVSPNNSDSINNLAKVFNDEAYSLYKKGNLEQAEKLWEKTLRYDSGNKAAKYYLKKIR